ncbi:MAG: rhamnogalacturonan acetylesterase [Breznakibacter sp.]
MRKFLLIWPLAAILMSATQTKKLTVFMVGDSTMANKSAAAFPETGWGQALAAFIDTTRLSIDNHAKNGRSTKSFISEGLWSAVENKITPGDYVFIQFGHNDEKKDKPNVYARAETLYKANLKRMIDETRAKGGIPVLFTSIVRRDFAPNRKLNDTHGAYIVAAKEVAAEASVVLIDLEAETHLLVERVGPELSARFYMHSNPAEYASHPNGVADNTHLSRYGAMEVAALAVECIKKQIPELAGCF